MSENRPTFLLVPGAYQGAWSWWPVARRLRAAGYAALAVTLPGLGDGDSPAGRHLSETVDFVVHEVEKRDLRDVVLVGHSWGGYPITGAAHRLIGRIRQVVYYNALVPARGRPLIDENPDYSAMIRTAIDTSPDGTVAVVPEQMPLLLPEGSADARRLLFELLVPQPGAYYTEALEVDDVTTAGIPAAYILSENDLVLARPGAEFAARIDLEPLMVPGGHESMLTDPDSVAQAILAVSSSV